MDFRSSFTRSGDNTSVQSTPGSKSKTAKNPFNIFYSDHCSLHDYHNIVSSNQFEKSR